MSETPNKAVRDAGVRAGLANPQIPKSPPGGNQPSAHSVEDALRMIQERCQVLETERVDLKGAHGRVLRESVRAAEDLPPFDRSSMDGYAIRLDDNRQAFRVVDEIRAGAWKPRELQRGEAVRIFTGAPLPCENLQVVMQEYVQMEENLIRLNQRISDRNIRFRGEDTKQGAVLLAAGHRLEAGDLAVLAMVGQTHPLVTRLPRIAHYVTGDEIVPPDSTPARGQIRDSNSILIHGLLRDIGLEARQELLPENLEESLERLRQGEADNADVLLLSGGASVGEYDFTRAIFERLGYEIHLEKLKTRPGKPMIFASRGPRIAFGLPGNPLAHYVCFHLFVRPALERMLGLDGGPRFLRGKLACPLETEPNPRETFWPARAALTSGDVQLTPLAWKSSGDITLLPQTNALLRVPAQSGPWAIGAELSFLLTTHEMTYLSV